MKYETPQLTVLTPAINAIQCVVSTKAPHTANPDGSSENDSIAAYADWE
jgi:hypothetical protein